MASFSSSVPSDTNACFLIEDSKFKDSLRHSTHGEVLSVSWIRLGSRSRQCSSLPSVHYLPILPSSAPGPWSFCAGHDCLVRSLCCRSRRFHSAAPRPHLFHDMDRLSTLGLSPFLSSNVGPFNGWFSAMYVVDFELLPVRHHARTIPITQRHELSSHGH